MTMKRMLLIAALMALAGCQTAPKGPVVEKGPVQFPQVIYVE